MPSPRPGHLNQREPATTAGKIAQGVRDWRTGTGSGGQAHEIEIPRWFLDRVSAADSLWSWVLGAESAVGRHIRGTLPPCDRIPINPNNRGDHEFWQPYRVSRDLISKAIVGVRMKAGMTVESSWQRTTWEKKFSAGKNLKNTGDTAPTWKTTPAQGPRLSLIHWCGWDESNVRTTDYESTLLGVVVGELPAHRHADARR